MVDNQYDGRLPEPPYPTVQYQPCPSCAEKNERIMELEGFIDGYKDWVPEDMLSASEAEVERFKLLLLEQVDATNVVTKELSACYAELGIFRHTDKPERGPDAIKRLREELKKAWGTGCTGSVDPELRRRAKE